MLAIQGVYDGVAIKPKGLLLQNPYLEFCLQPSQKRKLKRSE
jgi:hypothetical protein